MDDFNALMENIKNFFVSNWFNIVASLAIFVLGIIIIKLLSKLVMKIIYSTKIDNASGGFFVSILRLILYIVLLFSCASILGIDGNSFLVAFSSVALAIGLALKDSLSNIANGLVIIVNKPFKKGDHVSIGTTEGIVKKISILTTELTTADNKKIIIPNNTVATTEVINFSNNPTRRIDFVFCVDYDSDIKLVKEVLHNCVNNYQYTLKNPEPVVFMCSHSASSIDYKVRFWVNTKDYWSAANNFNEIVFIAFKEKNIVIPYNKLDVKIVGDSDEKNK